MSVVMHSAPASAYREKATKFVAFVCKPADHQRWVQHFGPGELSRTIRALLNAEIQKQTEIQASAKPK
jgi:hypothetical protein